MVDDPSPRVEVGIESVPKQMVALFARYDETFLLPYCGSAGPTPFLFDLQSQELPPTLSAESLLALIYRLSGEVGLVQADISHVELLPAETLRPFNNVLVHSAILDVGSRAFEQLRLDNPEALVISSGNVRLSLTSNMFFRLISESYRPYAPVPA